MAAITVENLVKTYTTYKRGSGFLETLKSFVKRDTVTVRAVDDISFKIEKGIICGILGPNGAGKSTTIKMLCGALFPSGGKIDVMGYSPAKDRIKYVRKIGAVFGQRSQLIWDIPPIDSFAMNKAIYGIKDSDYKKRLDELTELFDVAEVIHKPTRVLSLGERMKCEFIMAMLHNPDIVFLDEPTIGLDAVSKLAVRQFIRRINREEGTTVILTTHDMQDIEALARRIILIGRGRILLDGGLEEIRRHGGDTKTITFEYRGEVPALCDGMDMLESREGRLAVRLREDRCGTAQAIAHISSQVELLDLSVASPGAEELVAALYREYSI